ncbi:uncharacterized protein LOC131926969 [Physella acuta]|uniref:uncharacterized protein LOC131926969 n=1 Tax=Physella acuta TaxID=109671 RepID=UPI0027DD41FE|nr:uncharacterized protein LOC131926969 [Physella acuta]
MNPRLRYILFMAGLAVVGWLNPLALLVGIYSARHLPVYAKKLLSLIGFKKVGIVHGTLASFLSSTADKYRVGRRLISFLQSTGMSNKRFRLSIACAIAGNIVLVLANFILVPLLPDAAIEYLHANDEDFVDLEGTVVENVSNAVQLYDGIKENYTFEKLY